MFILPTSLPSDSCELRLIIRVGSMYEEDHERGFAHFIEHLGFKGTKSFKVIYLLWLFILHEILMHKLLDFDLKSDLRFSSSY